MKCVKFALGLTTLALGLVSAASHYNLNLDSAQWAGDKQLKPGSYRVELMDGKAVFKAGKTVVEVPATTQTADRKFLLTSYQSVDSKIVEIDLGGTNTKVVLGSAP